jgi:hypothetical protein
MTTYTQQVLDELLGNQEKWLLLENLFLNPHTVKIMSSDQLLFLKIDSSWKKILKGIKEQPFLRRIAQEHETGKETLNILINNNQIFAQINSNLQQFIARKIHTFPRLFLLSHTQILTILTQQ